MLLVVVALQPAAYHVERSVRIQAPVEVVWAQVSDFARWKDWNPWQKQDPDQTVTLTGNAGTAGHRQEWDGQATGKGSMTIREAQAPQHVVIDLAFVEPVESTAVTTLAVAPAGSGVEVTWTMDGENDFLGKAFALLMGMEEMIGAA